MRRTRLLTTAILALTAGVATHAGTQAQAPPLSVFFQAAGPDPRAADAALTTLGRAWNNGYAPMFIDMARLLSPRQGESVHPIRVRLLDFLEKQTHQRFGNDLNAWRDWIWKQPYDPHPQYAAFKAEVYRQIDPLMVQFFSGPKASIRLDEIDWGGVKVNGIPPLDQPRSIPASAAGYLRDTHLIFGIVINGQARAYPKRILAWHEMALDRLGGVELTVVYCTLCGTVIPYNSVVGGTKRTFGTSGLLYRANKLMFDRETMSLWSTLEGGPVVGTLAGQPLRLEAFPVVTTTWKEWKTQHPDTTVLSLETGYDRDYGEGVAYRDYFDTDQLMFRVPRTDPRLKNKDEILGVLLPAIGGGRQALAFSVDFLTRKRIHHEVAEGRSLVVITSVQGANRVYDAGPVRLSGWTDDQTLRDDSGRRWRVTEEALQPADPKQGAPLPRVTAFRAFWFGWFAQFPETLLVK
jgi:hypothetical protein